ncbi:hypothetical protein EYC80_005495 [Monilinia laxa]|uniref:DUF2406 domain-containing protein n=1 Tax=Monilinia laxa TaxID=61186 RepID=A0A5N6KE77_MONLA|nr:hypothetical protein EYC80_005495 [Monilinia laxa]
MANNWFHDDKDQDIQDLLIKLEYAKPKSSTTHAPGQSRAAWEPGSGHKLDLTESHREKEAKRLHTKADPSLAMTEAEPSAVANEVASSLAPIRAIQHRDSQGNPIADPDRSNPTRNRWERPLDTIRAFEAAIDGNYSSRKSMMRAESEVGSTYNNRRSSYYAATQMTNDERPRYSQNSYYGGGGGQPYKQNNQHNDGRPNGMARPDSYYTTDNQGHGNGYTPNRSRYPRTASEPQFNSGVYTAPGGQQRSYETVTTASGSSADAAGYLTDPSSLNSSVDGIHALPQPPKEPMETYGFNGFGNNPQYLPPGSGINERNGNRRLPIGNQNQGPPPQSKDSTPRTPMNLGITSGNSVPQKSVVEITKSDAKPQPEKRKSWFGRRLSKNK